MANHDPFAGLTAGWFDTHAFPGVNAAAAWHEWGDWYQAHQDEGPRKKLTKLLLLVSGKTAAAVSHYLHGRNGRLSRETWEAWDEMAREVGFAPPAKRDPEPAPRGRSGPRRIAVLTQLGDMPSPAYHLAVIRSVIGAAENQRFEAAIHEVTPQNLGPGIERVVRAFDPDAAIMIRLTPTVEDLKPLAQHRVPVVLIHGDRLEYRSPPVLTNIVPKQDRIAHTLKTWAPLRRRGPRRGPVVIVALEPVSPYSIRAQRIQCVLEGLADLKPLRHTVPDYTFRHGLGVFRQYPNARAFVCLSDELAVGIKHLCEAARGPRDQPVILGFDDSPIAAAEGITSFSQHLSDIGRVAVGALTDWLGRRDGGQREFPAFRETLLEVHLTTRDTA